MRDGAWIAKFKPPALVSMEHICQFFELWALLNATRLDVHIEDDIVWKLAPSGHYSAASAYLGQFLGMTNSAMEQMVWRNWAPPKVKFFAWLAIQDRIWTAERLEKRGWPNCGPCPLCRREVESGTHLFTKCRFTLRLWHLVKEKFHLHQQIDTCTWQSDDTIKAWWLNKVDKNSPDSKAMASLAMLVS